ncbi:hypothetical protein [Halorubrum ezzemoulense]|jgi:hypothetical protein|uniref:hypothetical protein n=1 Tax=Halorubrum ezzemoulense TaxID=337243 RepID=UPI002330AE99|nr:hypothetical protein [Halorubrum ezzemoulense]MDB9254105.1 hypothetical protein [Halorubrum ezzemoulense]MDB9257504.1 hypothetical protein [Halorubrum ezzemoulense]MDB9278144.1 hypothetical protein [Halorubrum ezzemoulense]
MNNIIPPNPLLSASVLVATASLVLQYLSHRSTSLDSAYEREERIDNKFKKIEKFYTGEITTDGLTMALDFVKSTVDESHSKSYQFQKYINPFSDIQGTTKLNFRISHNVSLDQGDYEIKGDFQETPIESVGLRVMPRSANLLILTVDSVAISDVADSLTVLGMCDDLKIQENEDIID